MSALHLSRPLLAVKTKIVATVGPACQAPEQLTALARAGADVFRINMAHGSRDEHQTVLDRIRKASQTLHRPLGILIDVAGPKIRLGELPGDSLDCQEGATLQFVRGEASTRSDELTSNYEALIDELSPGDRVMLADGTVELKVLRTAADFAEVRVIQGGTVRTRQGVNLPGVKLSVPALTEDDRDDAQWAAVQQVDFVGMSFVRTAAEIEELKQLLTAAAPGRPPSVIAKIEKPEALDNLDAIVSVADGVMVARGDLGVEIDVARVPREQKRIISTCQRLQKPVITATEMLDSMQHSRLPTRAEATDVANAILDGTDACMLSGETAVGDNPEAAVSMMRRIARETEPLMAERPLRPLAEECATGVDHIAHVAVHGAGQIASLLNARLLVVASHSGATALSMSKLRTSVPIVGVSDNEPALRQMCLYWGVVPVMGAPSGDSANLLAQVDRWGRESAVLLPGDRVVLAMSTHWSNTRHNGIVVHVVE